MTDQKNLHFYLDHRLLKDAHSGTHSFLTQLIQVVGAAGIIAEFQDSEIGGDGLYVSQVHHAPFWTIEQAANQWDWRVAQARFDPDKIDPVKAEMFHKRWQERLFGHDLNIGQDGYVYIPLQHDLTQRAPHQMASPIDMIMAALHHEPNRRVIAALTPDRLYSREEQKRLEHLQERFANFEVQPNRSLALLQRCDYVVTQNATAAFDGFFFEKPCVLFAKSDFHHIAHSVETLGVSSAFERVHREPQNYAAFLYWFWQKMSINAGHPSTKDRITQRLRRAGVAL